MIPGAIVGILVAVTLIAFLLVGRIERLESRATQLELDRDQALSRLRMLENQRDAHRDKLVELEKRIGQFELVDKIRARQEADRVARPRNWREFTKAVEEVNAERSVG